VKLNKYWFKPKKFGYGAYPITWEGWLVIFVFIIYLIVISKVFLEELISVYFAFLFVGIIILIYISKIKTKENWKFK
jgi:hypothetical protein